MSQAGMEDDLLDDLMNIVHGQNDDQKQSSSAAAERNMSSGNDQDDDRNEMYDEFDEEGSGPDDIEDDNSIDEMLEKPIDILDDKKDDQVNFYTYDKIQIKNIYWRGCQDTILPEGWVQVTHACGMPLYLNRATRVCTLSRPYYIGAESSARKHDIPASAIPCLAYQRRKEAVEKQIREHQEAKRCPMTSSSNQTSSTAPDSTTTAATSSGGNKRVTVSITTNEEKTRESMVTAAQLHDYCKRLFEFDVIKVRKFKTWNDRKKFIRTKKQRRFPQNSKVLKIQTKTQKGINKELNINMTNKTPLSILYEYSNQVFKSNPRFEIQEKENPKEPFQAVCYINEKVCGKGSGNSKKAAKNSAAEAALCVLIPEFKSQTDPTTAKKNNEEMYTFFDSYPVEHTHIYALSQKLGAPLPYDVLLTCLKYNFAMNMTRNRQKFIEEDIRPIKYRNCLYRMKLAQYDVEVNCTKKKEGRQLAAQKILKQMHPHIETWGSILRLYGSRTDEMTDEGSSSMAKSSTNETGAEESSSANKQANSGHKARPNRELLEKLREEMKRLKKNENGLGKCENGAAASSAMLLNTLSTIPPLILNRANDDVDKLDSKESSDGVIAVVSTEEKREEADDGKKRRRRHSDDSDESEDSDDESDTSTSVSSSASSDGDDSDSESSSSDTSDSHKNNSNSFSD